MTQRSPKGNQSEFITVQLYYKQKEFYGLVQGDNSLLFVTMRKTN